MLVIPNPVFVVVDAYLGDWIVLVVLCDWNRQCLNIVGPRDIISIGFVERRKGWKAGYTLSAF